MNKNPAPFGYIYSWQSPKQPEQNINAYVILLTFNNIKTTNKSKYWKRTGNHSDSLCRTSFICICCTRA